MNSPSPGLSTIIHLGIIAYKKAGDFVINFKAVKKAIPVPKKETKLIKIKKIILSAIIIESVFMVMLASVCAVVVLGFASNQSNLKMLERFIQLLT